MGYLGHLYPGRGIEVLIGMARSVPEADVHIVGGTDRDISAWRATQLPDNVFLHGYVPHSRVGAYLSRFDILAAPYQRQVFTDGGVETSTVMSPLKLFEYMACGKPILCSDLPVLREVLSPGEDALLVPPDDIRAWADAVRTLERDAELRTRLGSAARDKFLRKHTWVSRAAAVLSSKATSSNGN
jgi:glycosyltransferase involved in cell wall biosynthesis